jgi:aminoglycoside phosphotransferase (APT) family kinase protein
MSDPRQPDGPSLGDETREVRPGEELEPTALDAFMRLAVGGEPDAPPIVRQFPGGFSNLTYAVTWDGREFVLRRPPFGARGGSAHDMVREYRVLTALHAAGVRVPRPLALCEDPSLLGAPFYVMERVRGVILRGTRLTDGMDAAQVRALCESMIATLAGIHAVDLRAPALASLGNPEGYAGRQVSGWTRRWEAARTSEVPAIERAAAWLAERVQGRAPLPARPALVHNDYKLDNIVLDPADTSRVRAVLDWEMATVGDGTLDLGTSLAYWADADDPPAWRAIQSRSGTVLPHQPTRAELVAMYEQATGTAVDDPAFAYVLGLFKVAVIAQQIYARYAAGHTRDPRFASLDQVVQVIGEVAEGAIKRSS